MAKDKISDYSSTANSNTDIAGINIDEGCAPSGINDAIRTLMAQLKTWQSGGQDVYIHPAGSASAPSITANGDTNTGIFFPAADTIAFSEGGVEAMRLNSSGNVGINTTSPGGKFNVDFGNYAGVGARFQYNSSNTPFCINALNSAGETYISWNAAAKLSSDTATRVIAAAATKLEGGGGQFIFYNTTSSTAGSDITWSERMRLDASGNLGIGTTSPGGYRLNVNGTSTFSDSVNLSSGKNLLWNGGDVAIANSGTNLLFYTYSGSLAERARIDSSGNFLVGSTSTPGAGSSTTGVGLLAGGAVTIQRAAATPFYCGRSNDGEVMALYSGTTQRGQVSISGATTTYGSYSDYRLKENIVPLTGAVSKVMALKPSTFNFIEFPEQTINGFIAHEVAEVEPIAVTGQKDAVDEEGKQLYQSVDPAKLVPLLTAALQEQQAIITQLQADVAALKG